ncbi:serine/threonine protein phosphatase, partial [Streptomyces sp. NPDC039028]
MTEHPTSHEGRQPLAARSQERARPRQEAAAGLPSDVPAQPGGPARLTAHRRSPSVSAHAVGHRSA